MKKQIFRNNEFDFVLFFNSRNIRRKQISDTIWAYKMFLDSLSKEEAEKCCFMLKTQLSDNNGTDLVAVCEYLFGDDWEKYIRFVDGKLSSEQMSALYNMSDATILLTSNEGWGLALTESMLTGTPIIANVTGGMQDQMRFIDENGKWFTPSPQVPSNNTGKYKSHGEWAFPVFPACRSIQGSPITPYIWDDRCKPEDAANRIKEIYDLSPEERKSKGAKGREWALSDEAGFTAKHQGKRFIEYTDKLFKTWEPRERYEFLNSNEYKTRTLNHNLVY
jgi:glycosyltransferase involved in cell wall biosynthesis